MSTTSNPIGRIRPSTDFARRREAKPGPQQHSAQLACGLEGFPIFQITFLSSLWEHPVAPLVSQGRGLGIFAPLLRAQTIIYIVLVHSIAWFGVLAIAIVLARRKSGERDVALFSLGAGVFSLCASSKLLLVQAILTGICALTCGFDCSLSKMLVRAVRTS
jgi:hypothetical protein